MVHSLLREATDRPASGRRNTRSDPWVWLHALRPFTLSRRACFDRVFKKFGGFTSGIGIRYAPSIIVDNKHQACASKLIVGERMVPHVFIHTADAKPANIHDLLPSDTRFKILVFVADVTTNAGATLLRDLAAQLDAESSFLRRFGHENYLQVFDILCITSAERDKVDYTGRLRSSRIRSSVLTYSPIADVPEVFRSHWSKYVVLCLFSQAAPC